MRGKLRLLLTLLSVIVVFLIVSPYQLAFVETDSMDPVIQPNDDLFILDTSKDTVDDVSQGDVITFYSETRDRLTSHRVIEKTPDGLITKGDNSFETDQARGDPPVTDSSLEGKAVEFQDSVLTVGNLAVLSQFIINFRFEIIVVLLITLLSDFILPSDNRDRQDKIDITPTKFVLFASIVLILLWSGFVFVSSTSINTPNVVVEQNPDTDNNRFIEVGDVEQRSRDVDVNRIGLPLHTEYESVSGEAVIKSVENEKPDTVTINYEIGPFDEPSVKSPQFRAYSYPKTLPSTYIQILHEIHPIVASLGTVTVISMPIIIISVILFDNTKLRLSRYRWLNNRRGR